MLTLGHMVFGRLERLREAVDQVSRQRETIGAVAVERVRRRLSLLLLDHGKKIREPIGKVLLTGRPTAHWELFIDGYRDTPEGTIATSLRISTSDADPDAADLGRATIYVDVQEGDSEISYTLDGKDPAKSRSSESTPSRVGKMRGWESVSELDTKFFDWVERQLAGQDAASGV